MKVKWDIKKNELEKVERAAATLNGRKVQAGASGEHARLAGMHEYGSKIQVTDELRAYLERQGLHLKPGIQTIIIPEHAFLRNGYAQGINGALSGLQGQLASVLIGELGSEEYLEMLGSELVSSIKKYAHRVISPSNSSFMEAGGNSHPLADTGAMIESIRYEVK